MWISKYKNTLVKFYTPKEVFVIKRVKNTVSWTCVIEELGTFWEKELKKDKSKFHIEIVIKKDNKLHAKSNGFVNSINDHIDKKYYDVKIRYYKQPDRLEKIELDLHDYAKKGLTQEKQQMLIRQNLLKRLIQLASN